MWGGLFFGFLLFDCMDAGGRAMQERLPRPDKSKKLGCRSEMSDDLLMK